MTFVLATEKERDIAIAWERDRDRDINRNRTETDTDRERGTEMYKSKCAQSDVVSSQIVNGRRRQSVESIDREQRSLITSLYKDCVPSLSTQRSLPQKTTWSLNSSTKLLSIQRSTLTRKTAATLWRFSRLFIADDIGQVKRHLLQNTICFWTPHPEKRPAEL